MLLLFIFFFKKLRNFLTENRERESEWEVWRKAVIDKIQWANLTGTIGTRRPHGKIGPGLYSLSYCMVA